MRLSGWLWESVKAGSGEAPALPARHHVGPPQGEGRRGEGAARCSAGSRQEEPRGAKPVWACGHRRRLGARPWVLA